MWLGWMLIKEEDLIQLDFFDLCEPENSQEAVDLGSQISYEEISDATSQE